METKRKVLITGAAGRIGSFLTGDFAERYDLLLTDIRQPQDTHGFPFVQADIADMAAIRPLCNGIDTVVHLAADPNTKATWESLLPRNVIGLYNVFEATYQAGCRRIVYASTVNTVFGYPFDMQVHTNMPTRPFNLYGATKVWGEAVGCVYADQLGLSTICLRFGWVVDRKSEALKPDAPYLDVALTYEDLGRLVAGSIEAPDSLRFGIYHGVSDNRFKRLDITDARADLGYQPQDDAFVLAGVYPERRTTGHPE
ncbi:MAG: NAD(P)-dependent oxidoreductase [Chloroflexi bacterium]|nr:NAD(P)-dependent oxidoreductase [Chloroflexota bacterium]